MTEPADDAAATTTEGDPTTAGAPTSGSGPAPPIIADVRELRDPRDMRALAHPTRLALLEVLTVQGPMTATEASELVGESPSSCSFHLRTLAKHHFVEEAEGGTGRQRPWKRVGVGTSMSSPYEDPETAVAADSLAGMFLDRQLDRLRRWHSGGRHHESAEWVKASTDVEFVRWVTPEEATELNERITELLVRQAFRERLTDPSKRPPGARPMEALYYTFPLDPPGQEPAAAGPPPPDAPAGPAGGPTADESDAR